MSPDASSFVFVDTPEALAAACEQLRQANILAVDTEFHRENTYYPRFALLQVASRDACYLIDPLALSDLSAIWDVLCDAHILKIFHAARQDLEIILSEAGRLPLPLFDTQIAAALLGFGQQIGFGNLTQRILKKSLPKMESLSDWMARPLNRKQCEYAADDVIYLLPIHRHLEELLAARNRTDWLDEEQAALCDPEGYDTTLDTVFWRVKGVTRLKPRQLAVLRELAAWRETTAQAKDIPRRRIVADEPLFEMARKTSLTLADMARMRGLPGGVYKRFGNELLDAWQRGMDCPKEDWPKPAPRANHMAGTEMRQELLDTLVRLRAEEEHIAANILASRQELAQLASWGGSRRGKAPAIPCLRGWRRKLVGDDLLQLLNGEISLRLDPETALPVIEKTR
ncbi:MAG: ribonuclease D [Mariprofundaceae bacterium]|nr:ribonuclease D [Mariprofundaceae bacterium]